MLCLPRLWTHELQLPEQQQADPGTACEYVYVCFLQGATCTWLSRWYMAVWETTNLVPLPRQQWQVRQP